VENELVGRKEETTVAAFDALGSEVGKHQVSKRENSGSTFITDRELL
jgi:hypothetical protein